MKINTIEEWNINKTNFKTKEDEYANTYDVDSNSVSESFIDDMTKYSITLTFAETEGLNFSKTRQDYIHVVEKILDEEEDTYYELNSDKFFNSFLKAELKKISKYIRKTQSKKDRKSLSCSINVENSIDRYRIAYLGRKELVA
jgi:DNA mismatch repair ATPase MutS